MLPVLASAAYEAGQQAGEITLVVVLAAALVALVRRALAGPPAATVVLSPAPAPAPAALDSMAPPGMATAPAAPRALPAPTQPQRSSNVHSGYALGAAGVAVLLVVAVLRLGGGAEPNAWDSPDGKVARASFIAGCENGQNGGAVDCTCVFDKISAQAPYDTPKGFNALGEEMVRAQSSGAMPPVVIGAVRGCAS